MCTHPKTVALMEYYQIYTMKANGVDSKGSGKHGVAAK
jgi:hypothetical protein